MLETGIDQMIEIVSDRRSVSATELSAKLSVPVETIETWAEILGKENMVSLEYDRLGKLRITSNVKNQREKLKRVEDMRDDVGAEIDTIEQSVREESKALDEEHRSLGKFEEALKKEYGNSVKIESMLKDIDARKSELEKYLKVIVDEEAKIKDEYMSINQILKNKVKQIEETEENLSSYEKQKDRLFEDIEIIKRLSKAINKEKPADMAAKIEEIEKNILEIRKQSRVLDKKYGMIKKLMGKV